MIWSCILSGRILEGIGGRDDLERILGWILEGWEW